MSEDFDDGLNAFGFDDASHIKSAGTEKWKQNKPGEISRICIVSFNQFHEGVLRQKAREKGEALTDEEKATYIAKVDAKLAEKLSKSVNDLTEVDRLDIKSPKFWNSFSHFDKTVEEGGHGAGTFRCLSKYKGSQQVHQEVCCKKFGEADQRIAVVIMTYPMSKDKSVNVELLKQKDYTEFFIWTLSAKKFKKIEAAYAEAKADEKSVIDLKVELDGDTKYQKQLISVGPTSCWTKPDFDAEVRNWILEQGLRCSQHVNNQLGFKLSKEKLLEKLSSGKTARAMESSSTPAPNAQLSASYDDLIS